MATGARRARERPWGPLEPTIPLVSIPKPPSRQAHTRHTYTHSFVSSYTKGWVGGSQKSPHTPRRRGGQRARGALHRCRRSDCESKIRSRFPRALSRSLAISLVPPSATDSPTPSAPDSLVSRLWRESSLSSVCVRMLFVGLECLVSILPSRPRRALDTAHAHDVGLTRDRDGHSEAPLARAGCD